MSLRLSKFGKGVAAIVVGISVGLVGTAAPAKAHSDHAAVYTFGSLDGCQGNGDRIQQKYTDLGWGHQMWTQVTLVAASKCLRVETVTWSDHWTNGFRGYASVSLRSYWGSPVMAWSTQRYWVENIFGKMHARTDYQTVSLDSYQVDSVMNSGSIQIVHNRN
jgi:hypothetical protein